MIEPLYSPAKAAELLDVSVRTIQRLVASGELKVKTVGSLVRITESSIQVYIDRYNAAPCQPAKRVSVPATASTKFVSVSQGMDALNAVFQRELRSGTRKR